MYDKKRNLAEDYCPVCGAKVLRESKPRYGTCEGQYGITLSIPADYRFYDQVAPVYYLEGEEYELLSWKAYQLLQKADEGFILKLKQSCPDPITASIH